MNHREESALTRAASPDRSFDFELDRALTLMAKTVDALGHNPKPVVLHCARVALSLYERGYGREVVIAGVLHDLIEDTTLPPEEIGREFGDEVLRLVKANTFDESIADPTERYREMFARCAAAGRGALLVKAADILDNSHYYRLTDDEDSYRRVLAKMRDFIDLSEDALRGEQVWEELRRRWARLAGNAGDARAGTAEPERPRASAAVLRAGGREVLMVKHRRRDGTEYWQLPGGGVHPGETAEVAVLRELLEETGREGRVVRFLFALPYKYGPSTTYLVDVGGGPDAALGYDPEESGSDHRKLVGVAWVPVEQVRGNPEIEALLLALPLPHIESDAKVRRALGEDSDKARRE